MGQSESKRKLPYLIGVKENIVEPSDPNILEFDKLYNKLLSDLNTTSVALRDYIENIRTSSKHKYSEQEERKAAAFVSDNDLRNKSIYILGKYSQLVENIDTDISTECSIQGFCPRHVISEDGTERPLESLDRIHPCQNRACMKEQLKDQLTKYKRWLVTGKWPGDTAKPKSALEDINIDRAGLIEILERLQQSVLLNIELAAADHSTDDTVSMKERIEKKNDSSVNKNTDARGLTFLLPFVSVKLLIIVIILITIIVIIFVVKPWVVKK